MIYSLDDTGAFTLILVLVIFLIFSISFFNENSKIERCYKIVTTYGEEKEICGLGYSCYNGICTFGNTTYNVAEYTLISEKKIEENEVK